MVTHRLLQLRASIREVSQSRKTTSRTGGAVDWHWVLYQGNFCEDILESCDGGITRSCPVFLGSKDLEAER